MKYLKTKCRKCGTEISVAENDFAGSAYCSPCAWSFVGGEPNVSSDTTTN